MNGIQQTNQPNFLSKDDIAALSHYPSLVEIFDDQSGRGFEETKQNLTQTLQSLERIIVRGSREQADEAKKVADAVKTTIDTLDFFRQQQLAQK